MRPVKTGWYFLAVVIIFGGWMVGVVIAGTAWNFVRDASLQPARETVNAAHQSVAVFTDVPQKDRDIRCVARTSEKGAKPVTVPDASLTLSITRDGTVWTLIGFLNDGSDRQKFTCTPRDKATDPASYSVATVDGFVTRSNLGSGIGALSVGVGVVLAGWIWWCRRSLRQEEALA